MGNSGNIDIQTNLLSVNNGTQISASTSGNGNAGNLTIAATDIELIGTSADGQVPTGLGASVQPGATGNGGTLTIDTQRLSVQEGGQISVSTFGDGDGGNLTLTATDIELVGTSLNGFFPSGLAASVEQGATGDGGTLTINTQRLSVQNGAQIIASTSGNGQGGDLTITATNVELLGISDDRQLVSALGTSVEPGGTGNGGNLNINTQRLMLREGGQISTSTFGIGNGGNLNITATDVELIGRAVDGLSASNLGASVVQGATGQGGTITINAQRLSVREGGQISASTFGTGDGGNLNITATDVEIADVGSSLATSVELEATGKGGILAIDTQNLLVQEGAQILASTFGNGNGGNLNVTATNVEIATGGVLGGGVVQEARGNGGTLTVDTQRLSVREGGQISTVTFGNGNSGDITVTATDIELIGTTRDGQFTTGLATSVQPGATGKGGTLTINTQNLRIQEGAQILASTFGNGDAGDLTVNATNIKMIGTSPNNRFPSTIATSVESGAIGNAGILMINTQHLLAQNGAQVSAATSGEGNAGNLTIHATDIELIGTASNNEFPSGVFASAESDSIGRGGELTVNTDNLTVRDGASIDVRSEGTEAAGNLIINAPNIFLDNQASLNGETTAGEGNIILNTEDLRLRNNSNITTNATGEATGGNITINTETLTAIENSDISANAEAAFGGRVTINAVGVFGTAFRTQQSQFSDITATSELGPEFSGTVELNTELDPSSGLIDLTQTVVDPNDLIAQEFCRQRGSSDFVIRGRGGIAVNPNDKSDGNQINVDLVEPVPSQPQNTPQRRSQTEDNQPISSLDIIPARGWIRDENGDVILVSYDPTKTGVRRQPSQLPQCQP